MFTEWQKILRWWLSFGSLMSEQPGFPEGLREALAVLPVSPAPNVPLVVLDWETSWCLSMLFPSQNQGAIEGTYNTDPSLFVHAKNISSQRTLHFGSLMIHIPTLGALLNHNCN